MISGVNYQRWKQLHCQKIEKKDKNKKITKSFNVFFLILFHMGLEEDLWAGTLVLLWFISIKQIHILFFRSILEIFWQNFKDIGIVVQEIL